MKLKRLINIILYTFIILVPILGYRKEKIGIFPVSIDVLFGMLAIFLGITYILLQFRKEKKLPDILKKREIKYVLVASILFGSWSFISIIWAQNKGSVVSECMRLFEYIMLFVIILVIADESFVKRAFTLFAATMFITSLVGIFQIFFPSQSIYNVGDFADTGRVYSTFNNPNYWGGAINVIIFFPILNLIKNKNSNKPLNIGLILILLVNLVYTWTRASWIGFGIGIIVLCVLIWRKGLIFVPAIPIVALIIPSIRSRFMEIFNFANWTSQQRIKLWRTGFKMLKENPLTGVGNGNWINRYFDTINTHRELYTGYKVLTAHNSYIKEFAELGIIGGLAFLSMYFSLFNLSLNVYKSSEKYKLYAAAFIAAWSAYLFQNFFNNLMFIPQLNVFIWILSAILFKGYYLEKTSTAKITE